MQSTQSHAVSDEIMQIISIGKDALESAIADSDLGSEGARRINSRRDEFTTSIREAVTAAIKELSVTDMFKKEETTSDRTYPQGFKVKSVTEQLKILCTALNLQNVDAHDLEAITKQPPPRHAEGYYMIPRWQTIGKTYGEALGKVLAVIATKRKFVNIRAKDETTPQKFTEYSEGELGPDHIRQTERTKSKLTELNVHQKNPHFLVIPVQFGLWHRGRSIRRVREILLENEFGLDSFTVACMLITHPERFQNEKDLDCICIGDEVSYDVNKPFCATSAYHFSISHRGQLKFSTMWFGNAFYCNGSATGFLPK